MLLRLKTVLKDLTRSPPFLEQPCFHKSFWTFYWDHGWRAFKETLQQWKSQKWWHNRHHHSGLMDSCGSSQWTPQRIASQWCCHSLWYKRTCQAFEHIVPMYIIGSKWGEDPLMHWFSDKSTNRRGKVGDNSSFKQETLHPLYQGFQGIRAHWNGRRTVLNWRGSWEVEVRRGNFSVV
jgi:hypothetical protein